MPRELRELGEYVAAKMGKCILSHEVVKKELCVTVERESLAKLLSILHDDANCMFTVLVDICGVDYPDRAERFEVVYNLLSMKLNKRIRVKVNTSADLPVPTAVHVHPSAGWFEREVWDMYGVFFSDNPDLRRILTDYGFDGHPFRKDFPLTGYVEMRYDESQKRVIYEPVQLQQAYRSFDYTSPWEGAPDYVLPGDEKATQGDAA